MHKKADHRPLGLELILERPSSEATEQLPTDRGEEGTVLYPELDGDGDHVHFEMVPMGGKSLLWMTIRREIPPELAARSLRKIADLIERHGQRILGLSLGSAGSFSREGNLVEGPLRLGYDENGDVVIPGALASRQGEHDLAAPK